MKMKTLRGAADELSTRYSNGNSITIGEARIEVTWKKVTVFIDGLAIGTVDRFERGIVEFKDNARIVMSKLVIEAEHITRP